MDGEASTTGLTAELAVQPQPVGIYGWRKRCLYGFVLFLTLVVVINLALTIWILRVLDFSVDGMGKLRIVPKGIRLEGQAEFVQPLYVQEVRTEEGQVMHLESAQDIKLHARSHWNTSGGSLLLGNNKLVASCNEFEIVDGEGQARLSITEDVVTFGVDDLHYLVPPPQALCQPENLFNIKESTCTLEGIRQIYSQGSAVFQGSVQTPTLKGPAAEALKVTSEGSKVEIAGGSGVSLTAQDGDIGLDSVDNVHIQSTAGSIFLDSKDIFLRNIMVSEPVSSGQSYDDIFQLCMCTNGRIFLAAPSGDCRATKDICGNK